MRTFLRGLDALQSQHEYVAKGRKSDPISERLVGHPVYSVCRFVRSSLLVPYWCASTRDIDVSSPY
jgi:hypothetical protein